MPPIPMSAEERSETLAKIHRMVQDMGKVGKGLGRWYSLTHDDARARMYFRTVRVIQSGEFGLEWQLTRFSVYGS
jgi:hypothetical protein